VKYHEHTYKFYLNHDLLTELLIWPWWDFQTSEVNAKLAPVNMGPWNSVRCLNLIKWTTFKKTTFARSQKYEYDGRLKFRIHIYGENSWSIAFRQMTFVQWKNMDIPTSFLRIKTCIEEAFKYGDGANFWGYVGTNTEPL